MRGRPLFEFQGVIQENNFGVGRGYPSEHNASDASYFQRGSLGAEPLYQKVLGFLRPIDIGLKSIQIWWFSSSFFSIFLDSFFQDTEKLLI